MSWKHFTMKLLNWTIRLALFAAAFGLVVILLLSLDEFVMQQRLFFLRTHNWGDLITVTILGLLLAYVLKKLLILQWRWGVEK